MAERCVIRVFSLLSFFVLVIGVFATEHVPVLIWDSVNGGSRDIFNPSPLSKLSSDKFSDYIQQIIAARNSKSKVVIVVFVEENLSVEDFGWEDFEEHNSFPQLENLTSEAAKVDFLPSVHAPLKSLKSLGYPWHIYRPDDDQGIPVKERGIILVVKLRDAEVIENRPDFLRRHDRTISTIYRDLMSKYENVIALYTSRHSSRAEPLEERSVRRVRSLLGFEEGPEGDNATFWHDKDYKILLYTPVYPRISTNISDPSQALSITDKPIITRDDRPDYQRLIVVFSVNSSRKVTVRLRFPVSNSNYWKLEEVEYEEDGNMTLLKTSSEIYAPVGFSYHCGSEIVFKSGIITFNLTNVQIQPNVQDLKFGDAYDCVWFFSIAIWSGLFVTAILALIMIWGLSMILDIKTMDRFDDPKGKTITISASE